MKRNHLFDVARAVSRFVGSGFFLLAVLGQKDVVEAVLFVEFTEVYITLDSTDSSRHGMLPQGVAGGGCALVVGYKDVVRQIFFAREVLMVHLLTSVYHGLDPIFFLHELKEFVDSRHIEASAMMAFDIEDRDEVLFLFDNY